MRKFTSLQPQEYLTGNGVLCGTKYSLVYSVNCVTYDRGVLIWEVSGALLNALMRDRVPCRPRVAPTVTVVASIRVRAGQRADGFEAAVRPWTVLARGAVVWNEE